MVARAYLQVKVTRPSVWQNLKHSDLRAKNGAIVEKDFTFVCSDKDKTSAQFGFSCLPISNQFRSLLRRHVEELNPVLARCVLARDSVYGIDNANDFVFINTKDTSRPASISGDLVQWFKKYSGRNINATGLGKSARSVRD